MTICGRFLDDYGKTPCVEVHTYPIADVSSVIWATWQGHDGCHWVIHPDVDRQRAGWYIAMVLVRSCLAMWADISLVEGNEVLRWVSVQE